MSHAPRRARCHRAAAYVRVLVVAALLAVGGPALGGPPTDQVRDAAERLLKILEDPALKGPEHTTARRERIRQIGIATFDWRETARRVLGRHWGERTPAERQEFVTLFVEFIENTYASKLELYSGERIDYVAERIDGNLAVVETRFITRSGTEVPIDYRMLSESGRWRAYDVAIEGVSLVSNYRSQFSRIIQQGGYVELVKRLKMKLEEIEPGQSPPAAKGS